MTETADGRPPVAIGHIRWLVKDVAASTDFLLKLGFRKIHQTEARSILEVRGGTHVVLRLSEETIAPDTPAPIDVMVDDVPATREKCLELGMEPSELEQGQIHHWFYLKDPSGYRVTVTSNHASAKPV